MPNEANPFDQFSPESTAAPQQPQGQQASQGQPQGNPFDQFTPGSQSSTAQPQPTKQEEDAGAFMAGVENMNRSFGKMAEGVLQAGANISSALGGGQPMADYSNQITNYSNKQQQSADIVAKQHPTAALAGNIVGDALRTVPGVMAAGGGTLLAQMAKGALVNAGASALDIAPDTNAKIQNIMQGGALGAIGVGAGALIGKAAQGIGAAVKDTGRVLSKLVPNSIKEMPSGSGMINTASSVVSRLLNPTKAAASDLGQEIKYAGGKKVVNANGAAAKRLNTWLSPAEQIGTDSARTKEGSILFGKTATKEGVAAKQLSRQNMLKTKLNDTIDNLVPEGQEATAIKRDELFSQLKEVNLADDELKPLVENTTLNNYVQSISKDPNMPAEYKDLDFSNVYKLNSVHKAINDDLYNKATSVTSDASKNLNSDNLTALYQAKSLLEDTLNTASGGKYGEANKLSQQIILQNKINNSIGEINKAAGKNDISLSQIYEKLFPNKNSSEIFSKMVADTGGNPQVTQDLITVLNQIRKTPIDEILARPVGIAPIQIAGRNIGIIERALLSFTKGKYNNAMAQMLADNKWQGEVAKALGGKTLAEKAGNLALLSSSIANSAKIGVANQGKGVLSQLQAQQEENPQSPLPKGYFQ